MISSGGESKIRLIGRRMFIISAAKAIVVFGIVGRLISLQINESKKYKTLSDKNRFREWKFSPPRGLINDYFGTEIASNKQVYQLHIVPENSENLEVLIFRLKNWDYTIPPQGYLLEDELGHKCVVAVSYLSDS